MQGDLRNYFGFDVGFENREFPCWKLVATNEAKVKLKTAGGRPDQVINIIPRAKFRMQNVPVKRHILAISGKVGTEEPVILGETGIAGNIDIIINDSIDGDAIQRSRSIIVPEELCACMRFEPSLKQAAG